MPQVTLSDVLAKGHRIGRRPWLSTSSRSSTSATSRKPVCWTEWRRWKASWTVDLESEWENMCMRETPTHIHRVVDSYIHDALKNATHVWFATHHTHKKSPPKLMALACGRKIRKVFHLDVLCTRTSSRIGRFMLPAIERRLKKEYDVQSITLCSTSVAISFYERMKYVAEPARCKNGSLHMNKELLGRVDSTSKRKSSSTKKTIKKQTVKSRRL